MKFVRMEKKILAFVILVLGFFFVSRAHGVTLQWGDLILDNNYESMKKGRNNIDMMGIIEGKWCGKCHNKVAFPLDDCKRCHIKYAK